MIPPDLTVAENAITSWWTHPLAARDGHRLLVSSIGTAGTNQLRVVDPYGQTATVSLGGQDDPDDHNAGAIAVDEDEPDYLVFYARHGRDPWVRWRAVDRVTLLAEEERHLEFSGMCTYAQLLHFDERLWVFTRVTVDGLHSWRYRWSDDWAETWSDERVLIDHGGLGGVYTLLRPHPSDAGIVHLAVYRHPAGQGDGGWHNAGAASVDLSDGSVSGIGVGPLGNLAEPGGPAILPSELGQAITPGGVSRFRVLDVGGLGSVPQIAYAVWSGSATTATYKVKQWDGAQWQTAQWSLPAGKCFGHSPEAHYHGGVTFDGLGGLYTSREAADEWVIERWRPSGFTFVLVAELARSSLRLVRPYAIREVGEPSVIYQTIRTYGPFTNYDADLHVSRG